MAARKGSGFPFPAQLDPSSRPRSAPVPTTPYTDKELRKIDRRIKKRQEKLRRRYKEIHGKRVDWIDHFVEEGWLFIEVRFKDGRSFNLHFSPQIVTEGIELIDRRTGDRRSRLPRASRGPCRDDKPLREYYRRRL